MSKNGKGETPETGSTTTSGEPENASDTIPPALYKRGIRRVVSDIPASLDLSDVVRLFISCFWDDLLKEARRNPELEAMMLKIKKAKAVRRTQHKRKIRTPPKKDD